MSRLDSSKTAEPTFHKRLSHRMKAALYRSARVDSWLDGLLCGPTASERCRSTLPSRLYLRLYPERRLRQSPFDPYPPEAGTAGRVLLLTLVPPEDTGGGSRPAQLAVELHRRGLVIDWRYSLPIFPWPQWRRPGVPRVSVRHTSERTLPPEGDASEPPQLVLLEAPHPALCELARAARAPIVYDAIDMWDGALGAGWYDRSAEDWALSSADLLVASSAPLCAALARRSGRQVVLLPNAVDPALFDPEVRRPRPPDVRQGRPTVVFVGALWGPWIDLELIGSLARALPAAMIHLIGPVGDRVLPTLPNVFPLGPRPRSEIPAYLAAADVTIAPFAAGRLSAAVSPLKVYESVAAERWVASTAFPDVAGIPGVLVAQDTAAFVAAVRDAPSKPFPRDQAREFLRRHTWAARVDRLLELSRSARR